MAEAGAADVAFDERVAQEHLRLAQKQIGRLPLPQALIDGFLCWLLSRVDLLWPGLVWLGLLLTTQACRWAYMRRLSQSAASRPELVLRRLSGFLQLLGLLRGAIVPALFTRPVQAEHYMFTMVYVGMLAGTSASIGGLIRPFAGYAALACGSLALAWMLQAGVTGLWLGVLIVSLIVVLTAQVRDQAQGLQQLVRLACDNEALVQSLRVARDQSELASLSKTRFFAAASHDLRQPLHALSINATTLEILARRQADPMIRELSLSINRALNQSNGLLDSLLDISNLDANAVQAQMHSVDLVGLLDGVRDEFAALAAHKGLSLLLDLPERQAYAHTDPDLLRRILHNLVGNAIKFSQQGSVTLSLSTTEPGSGPKRWHLAVSDTGAGIAVEEQERVFEEFYQIGNTSRDRSKGLGLGLSIVKRTAVLLNAEIRLQSELGRGTCVAILLDRAQPTQPATAPRGGFEAVEPDMLMGLTVLVVDDEPEILSSLRGLLTQLGCAVRCACNGPQALEAMGDDFAPQLLLVDHRLRAENGIDVIARIRARHGPVPAVLVTGDTEPAIIQAAQAAGHRVVYKPVQGQVLAQVLREVSGGARPAAG